MLELYNIIAYLCAYIIKNCSEDFFVKYSCMSDVEKHRINCAIKNNIPLLFVTNVKIYRLEINEVDDYFCEEISNLVHLLLQSKDYYCIVGLVQVLDRALENILKNTISDFQNEATVSMLNTNAETTGIGILPRCTCCWERKGRLSSHYNRLDNYLINILLVEKFVLGNLNDNHIFLNSSMFENFASTRKINVAATPLKNTTHFGHKSLVRDNVRYFQVDYFDSDNETDNELVWSKILDSAKVKTDILVFPELLGNKNMEKYIIDKLKTLTDNEKKHIPSLIVLPSFINDRQNTAIVLDKHGNVICRQNKQYPFRYEVKKKAYLEDIKGDNIVNILHYDGIGRIAIMICKDFITTQYVEKIMRCFKLNLIIVPSFSTGSYDFIQSFDLCAHDDCNVIWINTCAAIKYGKEVSNFENIGYVRKRISRYDDASQSLLSMPYCLHSPMTECDKKCLFYETINEV